MNISTLLKIVIIKHQLKFSNLLLIIPIVANWNLVGVKTINRDYELPMISFYITFLQPKQVARLKIYIR